MNRLPKSKSFHRSSQPHVQFSSASNKAPYAAMEPCPNEEMNEPKPASALSKIPSQQRLSVAGLRRSFEKHTEPFSLSGKTGEAKSNSKPPENATRECMAPTSNTKWELLELPVGEPLTSGAGLEADKTVVEQPFFTRSAVKTVEHGWTASALVGSSSSDRQGQNRKSKALLGSPGRDPMSHSVKEKLPHAPHQKDASVDSHPFPKGGAGEKQTNTPILKPLDPTRGLGGLDGMDGDVSGTGKRSNLLFPSSGVVSGAGKVSQLRRLFEQSSRRISAAVPFANLRSRLSQEEPVAGTPGNYTLDLPNDSGSTLSTHTAARRLSVVPSLTTEISINDFFCDFSDSNACEDSSVSASPRGAVARRQAQARQESPVKHRIQQFEHLSRESLNHGKPEFSKRPPMCLKDRKENGTQDAGRGWWPIHKRGAAIWRRISNSFGRSLDGFKDCPGGYEQITHAHRPTSKAKPECSSSSTADARHRRRSSSFGYRLCRVAHTSRLHTPSPDIVSSSMSTSSSHSPLDASRSPLRLGKGLAAKTRPTSRLSMSGGVGLDGQLLSKNVKGKEHGSSSPNTPQGDPDALLKVMQEQSAEERDRRQQEEKYLRRNRKSRRLARWKDKGKALIVDLAPHSADGTSASEAGNESSDRGKGKNRGKQGERRLKETKEHRRKTRKQHINNTTQKTESGFAVFETKDVKLRHPKPSRPGQVRKMANMYKETGNSGMSLNSNSKASSGTSVGDSRQGFRRKASSALGLRGRKGDTG